MRALQIHHSAVARRRYVAPGAGAVDFSPYLLQQDFESPYDWTENGTGGTADESYTGVTLDTTGTKCLRVTTASQTIRAFKAVTASDSLTLCFILRFVTAPSDYTPFVQLWDGSFSLVSAVDVESGKFYLEHGISQAAGAMTYATGTNYYCWLEWEKSTSTNGKLNLFVSTTTTKPGSPDATRTAGTASTQAEYIVLGPQNSTTCEILFDHVRVKAGPPGTVTAWPL